MLVGCDFKDNLRHKYNVSICATTTKMSIETMLVAGITCIHL